MRWFLTHRCSKAGRPLADRHYNRQSIGASNFVPPSRCKVFVTPEGDALWVSSWPFAEYTKHEWAGAWVNSTFRNESSHKASELIREALAATRFEWPEVPELGMVTFIDREKVRPTIVRGKQTWGRSYLLAGFKEVGLTKTNRLLAFQILKDAMPEPMPSKSTDRMTKSLFGEIDS